MDGWMSHGARCLAGLCSLRECEAMPQLCSRRCETSPSGSALPCPRLGPSFLPGSSAQTPSLDVPGRAGQRGLLQEAAGNRSLLDDASSTSHLRFLGQTQRKKEAASPSSRGGFQPRLWEGITLPNCRNSLLPNTCRFLGPFLTFYFIISIRKK